MSQDLPTYDSLQPQRIWQDFAEIAKVPRPSKQEERIRARLTEMCRERGLEVVTDAIGNMIVRVPAAAGCEDAPTVILQAHIDMVCEKNRGTEHDFLNDPIRLVVDRDEHGEVIVRADGTTLGADNGIGVCMALAAADDHVRRPALEILLTVDEEAGMSGAEQLDASLLQGRILLNLDTEEDEALYVGCAGGCDTTLGLDLDLEPVDLEAFSLKVRGLRGGHSGGDIHLGRASANKVLARVLDRLDGARLVSFSGGSKRNALAREADAVLVAPKDDLERVAAEVRAEVAAESHEPGLTITVEAAERADQAASVAHSRRFIRLLVAMPHGVMGMHPKIHELVETSNNVATLEGHIDGGALRVRLGNMSRGSSASRLEELLRSIESLAGLAGATCERDNAYPGWQPNMDSEVLAVCRQVHEETFGRAPTVAAVHAGLECGLLGRRIEGVDMVSLGPRIEGAHSPDERTWVSSVQQSWTYLTAVLARLADAG